MIEAETIYKRFNESMLIATEQENDLLGIEDFFDPEGRSFRIEYHSSFDGKKAYAICLFTPWLVSDLEQENLLVDGRIWLGPNKSRDEENANGTEGVLDWVIPRVRYWCVLASLRLSPDMKV